jgi:hypothetical protein
MTEHADPTILHHRETDLPGSDFRRARHCEEREVIIKRNGTTAKVMIALAAICFPIMLTIIGALVVRDRASVDADLASLKAAKEAQALQIQAVVTIQQRVLTDLAEMKAGLKDNGNKLDMVLFETRRAK